MVVVLIVVEAVQLVALRVVVVVVVVVRVSVAVVLIVKVVICSGKSSSACNGCIHSSGRSIVVVVKIGAYDQIG